MTVTPDGFANYLDSTLAGGAGGAGTALAPSDTSLLLATGDGAKLPTTTPFQPYMLQLGTIGGTHELVRVTAISGDTLTLVRGNNLAAPDTTTNVQWPVGTPIEVVATAGHFARLYAAINTGRMFFPYDYGTIGGTSDDVAINAAITACAAAGGGVVQLEDMTHKTNASVVLSHDKVILRGYGFNSVIQPQSGAQYDAVSSRIPTSVGAAGYQQNYLGVENLMIDCSLMTGTTAGKGNGIHFYGCRYSFIRKVFVSHSPNWAILLDGDNVSGSSGNFGYDNSVSECIFDLCNAGCWQTNCEANRYTENQFKWAGAACAAPQPAFLNSSTSGDTTPGTDTTAMHLHLGSGYSYVTGNVFGNGGAYTTPAIRTDNSGPCRIIGNRFDQVRYQAVVLNAGNHLFAFNAIGTPSKIGAGNAIQIGSSNNIIAFNQFDNTAGAYNHAWAVAESGGPFTGNIIIGNHLPAGSSGSILTTAGSTHVEWGNTGVHSEVFKTDSIPAVATSAYQVTDADNLIYVDTTTAAFTVTLPNARNGLTITIKDKTGHCATNNVTINTLAAATIDGGASGTVKITSNYGVLRVLSDGTNWFII